MHDAGLDECVTLSSHPFTVRPSLDVQDSLQNCMAIDKSMRDRGGF